MTIKVCGITRIADARAAADLGVHAVGFVFWPGSPRAVTPAQARDIVPRSAAVRDLCRGVRRSRR